jgi:hypothetical protein
MSDSIPAHLRLWLIVARVNVPAFLVGAFAAITGHRWGAYVLIANLVVQIGFHLLVGWRAYQEVMGREWPKVAPLTDDGWEA